MAQKYPGGAAGGYPQGPPPPYQAYPQTTVVVSQAPPIVVHKPQRGLLGSLMNEVSLIGNQIGREIDYVGNKINDTVDTSASAPSLALFQTGNVVQFISRTTGKALQILMGQDGHLIVDGNGPVDRNAFHATWTVVNEGKNQVRLHNNNNYLTIVNGHTTLIQMQPGTLHGVETKFQLSLMGNFVLLESLKERGCHVGVLPTGQIKPALACGRENHAHFGVQLVYSPYTPGATVTTTVTVVKK